MQKPVIIPVVQASDEEVLASLDTLEDLDDGVVLVTILGEKQRLSIALLAAHLAEASGMLGSSMSLEHTRLAMGQVIKQAKIARDYVEKISG